MVYESRFAVYKFTFNYCVLIKLKKSVNLKSRRRRAIVVDLNFGRIQMYLAIIFWHIRNFMWVYLFQVKSSPCESDNTTYQMNSNIELNKMLYRK